MTGINGANPPNEITEVQAAIPVYVVGGSTSGGVTQIVAGTNVTISPTSGVGAVTVNATAAPGGITSVSGTAPIAANTSSGAVTVSIAAATATAAGAVPTPPNNTTTFLRGDATWATPPGITAVSGTAPVTVNTSGGTATISVTAATATASGLVPTPPNNTTTYLRGDATFATPQLTNTPVTAAYATPLVVAAAPYVVYRCVLTGDVTIGLPTGGADGNSVTFWLTASGAARNVSLNAAIVIPSSSTFTSPQAIASGAKARLMLQYDAPRSKWELVSFINGY